MKREPTSKIEIHPGHIGAAAGVEHAEQLVKALQSLGWPAKVVTGDTEAVWDFDKFDDLNNFERDLERVKDNLWPPYMWRQILACQECGCRCSDVFEGATVLKSFIDYDPAL